jgi:hypothetical protein
MSNLQHIEVHMLETWSIGGEARDAFGAALDLTGATVTMRVTLEDELVMDVEATITEELEGLYEIEVPPENQGEFVAGEPYHYEVRAVLLTGVVTVQNRGRFHVLPSSFA